MFKTRWYNRGTILSDEGFTIWVGRDSLVYRRSSRAMTISIDCGASEINVFAPTANRWDDDLSTEVDELTKKMILDDVRRALEWKRLKVNVLPYIG